MSEAIRLITRAADFAARRHRDQRRKGASRVPYVNHLTDVAALVAITWGGDEPELLAAAYLHDVVEDGHATAEEIAALFGTRVRDLVDELTDDMTLDDEDRRRRQVEAIASKSREARLIKLADKVSNLRAMVEDPPADWSEDDIREYVAWGRKVVDAGCRGIAPALEQQFDGVAARFKA
jgi:guanosine-3',5'-bis(diphosphate) 3'-pyrophosphohydrolase